ncbi:MAG: ABC transporter ATP-binding protein [Candidatus Promineifilaceae bacterium]
MNSSEQFVINTQGLGKSYDEVVALKTLDLKVPDKSIFAFLGPNGAGKTTTIKLLLGLATPTSGSGTIFGKDIVKDSVDIRASVGYLPQDARFYEHMSARETLTFTAGFFYKGPKEQIDKRVDEMIELVGLEGKADRPIKGFSGGERQRLGIAQAEVNYPDLLILDEPAASLDPQGRRDVLAVMSRIRKYATIFYCTHILDDVQRVSDTVAIVNEGTMITQAPIEELLSGTGEIVYSVKLREAADNAYAQVTEQAWVSGVEVTQSNGEINWQVSVTDEAAAEDQLLNLLVSNGAKVADFGRKAYALEDIFLDIVKRSEK